MELNVEIGFFVLVKLLNGYCVNIKELMECNSFVDWEFVLDGIMIVGEV